MPPIPAFGTSNSPWEEVKAFYDFWGDFLTAKDFAWADKFHTAAASNRWERRRMEEENRKMRKSKVRRGGRGNKKKHQQVSGEMCPTLR